jgi:hypothetical protein
MSGIEVFAMAAAAAGALNTIAQGNFANKQAKFQASQLAQMANRQEAISQREAIDRRKEARYLASRATAMAGASGAGVTDPDVQNIIGEIETQGEYNALVALYDGKMQARDLRAEADAKREAGRMAKKGAYLEAIGNLGKSMYEVYPDAFTNEGLFGMKGTAKGVKVGSAESEWGAAPGYSLKGGLS